MHTPISLEHRMDNLCRILRQYGIPDEMKGREYVLRGVEIINTVGFMGPAIISLLADDFHQDRKDILYAITLTRRRMQRHGWTPAPLPPSSGANQTLFFLHALNKQSEL